MKIGDMISLRKETGKTVNATITKIHLDGKLNLLTTHPNGTTQNYFRIEKFPQKPKPNLPYWAKKVIEKASDTVKVVDSKKESGDDSSKNQKSFFKK